MSDSLLQAINSFQSSRTRVKEKIISLRSCLDKMSLEMEKSDTCYERMLHEVKDYRRKINKGYEKKIKDLEDEIETLNTKISGFNNLFLRSDDDSKEIFQKLNDPNNWYIEDDDGELLFVSDSIQLKIASTVSILDVLVREIANGPNGRCEGFERISFSILYPAIYSRLGLSSGEDLYLTRVPDSVDDIIKLGKEFHAVIDQEIPGHLTYRSNWEANCRKITNWWVKDMIPLIYDGVDLDLSNVDPYSYDQMKSWSESREDRGLEFGEVNDVIEISNKFLFNVIPRNGLKELSSKIDSGYFDTQDGLSSLGLDI